MAKRYVTPLIPFQPNQPGVPSTIQSGVVFFVDQYGEGIWATETMCNAYGYVWDPSNNTCRAFDQSARISEMAQDQTSNFFKGGGNQVRSDVNASVIVGQTNTMLGKNTGVQVVGNKNQVESNIVLLGTLGNSVANNTLVIGGNSGQNGIDAKTGKLTETDILGERQVALAIYGGTSVGDTPLPLGLNNVINTAYPIPTNAVFMFEIDIMAVAVVGGKSVPVGSFMTFKSNGVTLKKTSGEIGTPIYSTTSTVLSSGKFTWTANPIITATQELTIIVRGERDTTIEWVADIKITQIQTSVNL